MTTARLSLVLVALVAGCDARPAFGPVADDPFTDARSFIPLRLMTWNIETVGAPGSIEYNAALEVIERLDPTILCLQEVANTTDAGYAEQLAADAGYRYTLRGWPVSFGADHQYIFSKRNADAAWVLDSFDISVDPTANDLTRAFPRIDYNLPSGRTLSILTHHFKALNGDDNEFRRSIEARRAVQAVDDLDLQNDPVIILGDLNEDPNDLPLSPSVFTTLPSGLPVSFDLGSDMEGILYGSGLPNDPFQPLIDAGMIRVQAAQRDGDDATFIGTNGVLDHVWLSPDITLVRQEIYDSADEGIPTTLHLNTPPLSAGTLALASDHHPIVVELKIDK